MLHGLAAGVRAERADPVLGVEEIPQVLGAALRVAYLVSASTTGVLPKTPMVVERGRLVLRFENGLKTLAGERVFVRLRQLARLIGREPVMEPA